MLIVVSPAIPTMEKPHFLSAEKAMEICRLENYATFKIEWSTDTHHKWLNSEKMMSKVQDIRHKRSHHWCGMPRIGSSIGLGSGFPGPRWRRLLGMTSDWTGHRLLPWRRVFTLSAAIVTSYNMDGLPHRLVIYRKLQANCKSSDVYSLPICPALPFHVLVLPFLHARHWTYI